MTKYETAVQWIAQNDGSGDTLGLPYYEALAQVKVRLTVGMVSHVFDKDTQDVAIDVLRARGFRKPYQRAVK